MFPFIPCWIILHDGNVEDEAQAFLLIQSASICQSRLRCRLASISFLSSFPPKFAAAVVVVVVVAVVAVVAIAAHIVDLSAFVAKIVVVNVTLAYHFVSLCVS